MNSAAADARQIPSLNGIRALSFGVVFLSHALALTSYPQIFPGMFGVTVFFVLSGFLITTLMRQEYESTRTVHLGSFYLRRCLRLFPPLYIWLIVVALIHQTGILKAHLNGKPMLAYAFYVGNYYLAFNPVDHSPLGTRPLWSLAVEEHFYLLFPLGFLALKRFVRGSRQTLTLIAVCLTVLAWRTTIWVLWQDQTYIEHATDTRMDALLIGCALAVSDFNPWLLAKTPARAIPELILVVVCVAVIAGCLVCRAQWFRDTLGYTLEIWALVPIFWLAIQRSDTGLFSWLNGPVMVYVGSVSYVLYLVHDGLLGVFYRLLPHASWMLVSMMALAASFLFADIMRRFVEKPLGDWRKRLHRTSLMKGTSSTSEPDVGVRPDNMSVGRRRESTRSRSARPSSC
ncbi:MAG TPA: acyltransferase [Steroidobacteraceae bacterium]|nr:acyltransferase [Steroidobacteraceae bacterium]